jgi:hypothetical protein
MWPMATNGDTTRLTGPVSRTIIGLCPTVITKDGRMSQLGPMWPKLSSGWDKHNARCQAKAWHSGKAKGQRNGKLAKVTVD